MSKKFIKGFEKFNEDTIIKDRDGNIIGGDDRMDQIKQANDHRRSLNKGREGKHDLHLSNLKEYGTITINDWKWVFSDFKVKKSSLNKIKILKFYIGLVPEDDVTSYENGGNYNTGGSMGLLVRVGLDGKLISIDETLDESSTEKVKRYITDNYKFENINENNNETPEYVEELFKTLDISEIESNGDKYNDYELEGYDEEGVTAYVDMYKYRGYEIHIAQWLPHSVKGDMKEIIKIDKYLKK